MKKTSKARRLLFPLMVASAGILMGCTNNDYDFDEIDMTLGLGGDEIFIPTSSTKEITLDDILKLKEDDCVKMLDNGDYVFIQEGEEVDPARPKIDEVSLTKTELMNTDLDVTPNMSESAKKRARAGENIPWSINESATVLDFTYAANEPEILEIMSAAVSANMNLSVSFSENLARCIGSFEEVTLQVPEYMVINSASGNNVKVDGNLLKLTGIPTSEKIDLKVTINSFDFQNNKALQIDEEGGFTLTGDVKLAVKAQTEITPEIMENYLSDWTLKSNMELDKIVIQDVVGRFNPTIDLSNLGDVEVSSTPDFLKDDEVRIDLANPQILVQIDNNMNVAANINATLTAIKDNQARKTISIEGINIHPNTLTNGSTVTKICICRDPALVSEAYADYDKYEVEELSELISTIPDKIQFGAVTTVDKDHKASFDLGTEYEVKPSYSINAPIAFGKNANIVYTDSIDDMHGELDGFELSEGAYLEITADVENKMPVFLNTEVTPYDVNGTKLNNVNVAVEENIPAAADGQTAKGNLKITIKGDIKQLDMLKFTIGGSASEGTESVTGITLNKLKHSLKLDNVKIKLVGKVIYDAN